VYAAYKTCVIAITLIALDRRRRSLHSTSYKPYQYSATLFQPQPSTFKSKASKLETFLPDPHAHKDVAPKPSLSRPAPTSRLRRRAGQLQRNRSHPGSPLPRPLFRPHADRIELLLHPIRHLDRHFCRPRRIRLDRPLEYLPRRCQLARLPQHQSISPSRSRRLRNVQDIYGDVHSGSVIASHLFTYSWSDAL
jgi:hypothetical protein